MITEKMTPLITSFLTVTSLCLMTCSGLRPRDIDHRSRRGSGSSNAKHVQYVDKNLRYGVLLDAGSSSTKVKVYSYTPGELPTLVPHVQLQTSERIKPGLGHFVTLPLSELEDYIADAVHHATRHVPRDLFSSTPVYIMATAGLRVLGKREARRLLGRMVLMMQNDTINPFHFSPDHVGIISGEEEAVYAWLAVNYIRGFFSTDMRREDSVGVLEMGGGSMQVAFLPDGPLYQEEFQVYLGRRRFDLYAQTYLSYGSHYITDQVRRAMVQQGDTFLQGKRLFSPCMLVGDSGKYRYGDQEVKVVGTGNASQCEQVLQQVLAPAHAAFCSPSPCAIGDTYQPSVGAHTFFAISAFLYAPRSLGAVEDNGVMNISKLRRNAENYCDLTVPQAVALTGTRPQYASNDCLMGLYIPLLLTTALGFEEKTDTVIVANEINGTRIDWALGAMLQHLSMTFMEDLDSVISCGRENKALISSKVRIDSSDNSAPQNLSLTLACILFVLLTWLASCLRQ